MSETRTMTLAAIRGDGIGVEVVEAALPAVIDAAAVEGVRIVVTDLDWGGERLLATGAAMPDDAIAVVRAHDAVLLGAVGHPALTPEQSVWTLTLPLRKALNLYANVRPIRSWSAISGGSRDGDQADLVIVRENTEGEYSGIGGRVHAGTEHEVATDVAVHSRRAISQVSRYAFELARRRGQTLTLATKSNVVPGYRLWDEVVFEIGAEEFPDVALEPNFVDALGTRLVQRPGSLGVVLAGNLFGDILSDVAAPLAGGLGMAPSANVAPGTDAPGIYESVHGSAPDIAGLGIANPHATILSGAMMLRDNGLALAADALEAAVGSALLDETARTPDLGGHATTQTAAEAVRAALATASGA